MILAFRTLHSRTNRNEGLYFIMVHRNELRDTYEESLQSTSGAGAASAAGAAILVETEPSTSPVNEKVSDSW